MAALLNKCELCELSTNREFGSTDQKERPAFFCDPIMTYSNSEKTFGLWIAADSAKALTSQRYHTV